MSSADPPIARTPTGVVTFLFTDVEGSTALWAQDADAMSASLRLHDAIVRSAIEQHDGYVFTTAGDAFCVAFDRASDGLATATTAQDELTRAEWPGPALRVRMGLHLGEAEERDDDYFGPVVNIAARVEAAGHGGQVLCTDAVTSATNVEARDVGFHRLKGVSSAIQLWQLGDGSFPPLRTSSDRWNVPTPPTSLLGRHRDIDAVRQLLRASRLVTLTAVGGAGKTRLAIAVAEADRDEWPNGVCFVDLTSASEDHDVVALAAGAIGLDVGQHDATQRSIAEHLAHRPHLVILDNCEHVVDGCAALTTAVLAAGGDSRVLATSREWIDVPGERIFHVPSLALDPDIDGAPGGAVELFVERAVAVQPSFRLDRDNHAAIAEICRRLDGMPLAIELAAARSAVLSPQELAEGLDDRFRLLSGRRRRQRGRTLESTLDWSYELLDADEQRLFRALGVFVGSFDVSAAADLLDSSVQEAAEMLESLVIKSLVAPSSVGPGRFRLLETLKAYAEDRLVQHGEISDVRSRHANHYLRRATPKSMIVASDVRRVVSLEPDFANLHLAADECLRNERWSDLATLLHAQLTTWLPDADIAGRLELIDACRDHLSESHAVAKLDVCTLLCAIAQADWPRFADLVSTLEQSGDAEGEATGHLYRTMLLSRTDADGALDAIDRYVASVPPAFRAQAEVVANGERLMIAMQRNDRDTVREVAPAIIVGFEEAEFLPFQWAAARTALSVVLWEDGDPHAPGQTAEAIVKQLEASNTQAFRAVTEFFQAVTVVGTSSPIEAADAVRSYCVDLMSNRYLTADGSGVALLAELARSEGDLALARTLMRSWTRLGSPDTVFFGRRLSRLLDIDEELEAEFRAHRRDPNWHNERPRAAMASELERRGWSSLQR